jgi:hypothetical protein
MSEVTSETEHSPVQTKCYQRWVGQDVWREVYPTLGPLAFKTLGIRRGKIISIHEEFPHYTFSKGLQLHQVAWEANFDWHTGEPKTENLREYEKFSNGIFEYGLTTPFEMTILVRGGLLQKGTAGVFTEPQIDRVKILIPLYKRVLANPNATFFSARD